MIVGAIMHLGTTRGNQQQRRRNGDQLADQAEDDTKVHHQLNVKANSTVPSSTSLSQRLGLCKQKMVEMRFIVVARRSTTQRRRRRVWI